MTFRISPGVYPQLEDLSERVPNFISNTGAICFASLRGPTDLQFVTNRLQFAELYGEPTPGNAITPGNGHDTANLFLEEASALYCLRVTNGANYGLGALVVNGGSGYTTDPSVFITPPDTGEAAEALAKVENGIVTEIIVINPGSGYTSAPAVTVDSPGGSGVTASVTASVRNGRVEQLNLVEFVQSDNGVEQGFQEVTPEFLRGQFSFADYQTPFLYFVAENPGEWANEIQVGVNRVNRGISKQASLTFSGPVRREQTVQYDYLGETRSVAFSRNSDNTLRALASDISIATNAIASVTSVTSGVISAITVDDGGSGYTGNVAVTFSGGDGDGAVAEAVAVNGVISEVVITNGGSGYTSAPSVTIADPPAVRTATATATVSGGEIDSVTITDGGSGYVDAPTLQVSGGGGSLASLQVNVVNGVVTEIVIVSGGSGYTNVPTLTLSAPPSAETATATAEINTNDDLVVTILGNNSENNVEIEDFRVVGSGELPEIELTISRENVPTDRTFNLQVFEGSELQPREEWVVSLLEQVDGFGVQKDVVYQLNESSARSNRVRVIATDISRTLSVFNTINKRFLTGGTNGATPTDRNLVAGWNLFANSGDVTVQRLMSAGYTSPVVLQTIANIARNRRDAFAILDVPSNLQEAEDAVEFRTNQLNINSSYAAMYAPDIEIFDEFTGRRRFVPPSGAIGAVFSFTSRTAELWFAPAGLRRGIVNRAIGLRHNFDEGQRDLLAQAQINPIVRLGASIAIWGEYTLQVQPSALQSVPVRLLMTSIEVAIADSLNSNVFDPNDPQTRFLIRARIEDFLLPIRRGRGLEEFRVICDETNNPPEIRDQRVLVVDVYVKPVLAALYIRLNSILTKSSASFDEIISLRAG